MKIITIISFLILLPSVNVIFAQATNSNVDTNSAKTSNGIVIHEAQGVEKIEEIDSSNAGSSKPLQKWNREQLISIMNDCEQKRNAVSDPKEKDRYANEIADLKKKIALLENENEK